MLAGFNCDLRILRVQIGRILDYSSLTSFREQAVNKNQPYQPKTQGHPPLEFRG